MVEQRTTPNNVIRKISGGNISENDARANEVMISIVETYRRRDQNFLEKSMLHTQDQFQMARQLPISNFSDSFKLK